MMLQSLIALQVRYECGLYFNHVPRESHFKECSKSSNLLSWHWLQATKRCMIWLCKWCSWKWRTKIWYTCYFDWAHNCTDFYMHFGSTPEAAMWKSGGGSRREELEGEQFVLDSDDILRTKSVYELICKLNAEKQAVHFFNTYWYSDQRFEQKIGRNNFQISHALERIGMFESSCAVDQELYDSLYHILTVLWGSSTWIWHVRRRNQEPICSRRKSTMVIGNVGFPRRINSGAPTQIFTHLENGRTCHTLAISRWMISFRNSHQTFKRDTTSTEGEIMFHESKYTESSRSRLMHKLTYWYFNYRKAKIRLRSSLWKNKCPSRVVER